MGKLGPNQVKSLSKPGRYIDGEGLMLDVKSSGSKNWTVRLQREGRRRDYGLGSVRDVSLSEARDLARTFRKMLRSGVDPLEARNKASATPTFIEAAEAVHKEHKGTWRNAKHKDQWLSTLKTYAYPSIGQRPVDKVTTSDIRDLLAEIWLTKPETARRVRQRIGTVLDYAHGKTWREPFLMAAVNKTLPKQPRKTGHFEALPYSELPTFLKRLDERPSVARLALAALILTASRSGEIRLARWGELDLEARTWAIPANRMKSGRDHLVQLSEAAVRLFKRAQAFRQKTGDLVFPGIKERQPLSDMTLLKILRDMGVQATVHGFRSAFRDWCAEETNVPGEVAEAALAHVVKNRVEAAYRRTDFLEKRRLLMEDWGRYCSSGSAKSAKRGALPAA